MDITPGSSPSRHAGRHYRFSTRSKDAPYPSPDTWFAQTPVRDGSWRPCWQQWLVAHSSETILPPAFGDARPISRRQSSTRRWQCVSPKSVQFQPRRLMIGGAASPVHLTARDARLQVLGDENKVARRGHRAIARDRTGRSSGREVRLGARRSCVGKRGCVGNRLEYLVIG